MTMTVENEDTGKELEALMFEDSQTPLLLRKPFVLCWWPPPAAARNIAPTPGRACRW